MGDVLALVFGVFGRACLDGGRRAQEAIAQPGNRLNPLGMVGVIPQLGPQAADIDLQIIGLAPILIAPDFCQQGIVGQYVPRVARQVVEQPVLNRGELDQFALDMHFPAAKVDGEVPGLQTQELR